LEIVLQDNLSENNFLLHNNEGYTFGYEELSSGEQSFLILILLIYSHDLQNGFLIIDEPELHLHPQSQKAFLLLLEEMKTRQNMQCIISTHSPMMINEHNINHVFRCGKQNGATEISSINSNFSENESTLLQMLKFDNIAKIFFVDTIILVE
jgi:predicted ATP-dependent endonuclease of OLD family